MPANWYQDTGKESRLIIDFPQEIPNMEPLFRPIMGKTHFREPFMRRIAALVLLFLPLCSLLCFGQTFLIVVKEIRDGEELSRPLASQEGMIAAMFDLGFVSFDTGLYAPSVDWEAKEFQEPLDIARQGLAQYVLAAEVQSIAEKRNLGTQSGNISATDLEPELKIDTSVHYYLLGVEVDGILGEGEMVIDNRSPEKQQFTYWQFLFSVGQDVAAQGIELLKRITVVR
jgi:hypothetical protein